MSFNLTRYEKETVINFNDAEKIAYISTSQNWMKERLKKLQKEFPNEVKITKEDEYILFATVPKRYIKKIGPGRRMTEEQKKASAERLQDYWKNK